MVVCPECGAQQAETARFCQQCGAALDQDGPVRQQGGGRNPAQNSQTQTPRQQGQPRNRRQQSGPPHGAGQPNSHGQPTGPSHGSSVYEEGYRDAGFGMVPPGIKFLCIAMGVLGAFLLLAGGISADMGSVASEAGASDAGSLLGNAGAVFMLIGIGSFAGIYGLWHRRTWGWFLTAGLFSLGSLVSLSLLGGPGQGLGMVLLVVQGAIVGYLVTKRRMYEIDKYLS